MDLIINRLLLYSFLEKRNIQKHVKHEPPSLNTFMKFLRVLTELVEQNLSRILPDRIALILDGWTTDSVHYLGVFAAFPMSNNFGYESD